MKTTLTDRAVKAAKADIADAVVPGLLLRVRSSGAKSYTLVEPSHSAASQHGSDEQMFGLKQQLLGWGPSDQEAMRSLGAPKAPSSGSPQTCTRRTIMNWKLLLAAGAIAIIPASAQAQTAADCPQANEVEDVEFCQPSLTPNERVKQAFEMLNFPVNGPFMSAYSDTAPFVCSVVGPDRWCVNPFDAMAKGEGGKQ